MIMHCCRIVNAIKNKNIKNSLGATWNASHLAVRLCALRHWKRVSMPPTTQSLRHPLTRAFHVAPRIKTARRSRRKTPDENIIMVRMWYFMPAHNRDNMLKINRLGRTQIIGSTEKVEKRDFRAVGNGILWLTPCKLACERSLETGPNIVASVGDGRSW